MKKVLAKFPKCKYPKTMIKVIKLSSRKGNRRVKRIIQEAKTGAQTVIITE